MGERTENWLTFIKYVVLLTITSFLVLQNLENMWPILLISGFLAVSMTIRNAVLSGTERIYSFSRITVFIDLLLAFFITLLDDGNSSRTFYYLIMADSCILFRPIFGGIIGIAGFIMYVIEKCIYSTQYINLIFILDILQEAGRLLLVYIVFCIIVHEINQKDKLNGILFELKIKSKQLEDAYAKLKDTSEVLEEVTVLRERNRIAREIHDTVGHTLTTVLLEMEAGGRLIKLDPPLAEEKINLAKSQVRKGLNDLRESVKILKAGKELIDFVPSIKLLIEDVVKHSGIIIKYTISEYLPSLSQEQQNALYRALQEGITNGIKHGKSTAFIFLLTCESGNIRFTLEDNGCGTDKIIKGFGLTAMEERINAVGGSFRIESEKDGGCCIDISLPLRKEEKRG